jgi:uncharacterized protein (TIGR03435 family)
VGATLKMLIMFAYSVKAFQISGAPAWVGNDLWEIEAKAEVIDGRAFGLDSPERVRALLEERYRLRVRKDQRTMPIYALVAEKRHVQKLAPAATDTQRGICPCGLGALTPKRATMQQLADHLSTILWRIVIDKTGLKGGYAFKLEWTPELNEEGPEALGLPPGSGRDAIQRPVSTGPSLSTALKEQLGLQPRSERGPVPVIVIESVEKPSEN